MKASADKDTKICTKCGNELPATEEYFYPCKENKDGLRGSCKTCMAAKSRKNYSEKIDIYKEKASVYYQNNQEHIKEKIRLYRENNKKKVAEREKAYKDLHKSEAAEYGKKYREKNSDIIKLKKAEYCENNKDKISEYHKNYYLKNAGDIKKCVSKYCKANKDRYKVIKNRHKSKDRGLEFTLTLEQWNEIKNLFGNKCAYCGAKGELTQDHFVPVYCGGAYAAENIIPACAKCNSSKKAQRFEQWYPKQDFYSAEREVAILKAVNRYAVQRGESTRTD